MMRAATVARVCVVCVALGSIAWAAVPMTRHMAGIVVLEAEPAPTLPVSHNEAAPDLTGMLTLAPFGRVPTAPQSPVQGASDMPDIVLRGIFAARDAESAALLDVDGEPGLYRVAMKISDRLDVVRITPALVELADGTRTIILRFDSDAEIENSPQVVEGPSLHERLSTDLVIPATYEKPGKPETTAEYIDYWRHRVRKNPQAVLDEIGLRPTDQGYVIADTHDVGVRLAGLRSGDLVRKVNGRTVGDPETDRRFYDEIAAAGQARIEVERGGQVLSFSFPLR